MATTPTNKPIPSEDPRDLKFNAGKIDEEVNGSADYYTDRFSVQRLTNTGRNNKFQSQMTQQADDWLEQFNQQNSDFQQFLLSSGYQFLGDYENGPYTITARNQIIRYQNEFWRLNAATNPPYATTGVNSTSWTTDVTHLVSVGDATLRQDIYSNLIFNSTIFQYMNSADKILIQSSVGQEVNVDYALQAAVAAGVKQLHFPPVSGIYVLGASPVTLPAGFSITGVSSKPYTTSSDASFNNRGTVLRLATGASSIFILTNRHRFFNVVFDGRDKTVNLMKGIGTDQTQYCRFDSCGIYRWLNGVGGSSSTGYTATLQVIGCSIASNYRGVRNVIDSRFTDCTINANGNNGVELNAGANNNSFVNVRNEWNDGANYVASGAKRNVINGELIDRAGLNAIVATNGGQWIVSGATIQRSGRLAVAGSADDSHFHVSGATSFIIIDGFYTLSGANDDGSGTVSPSYTLSGGGSSLDDKTFIATGGNLSGFTTAWLRPGTVILSLDISACRGVTSTKNNGFFQIVDGATQLGETITQSLSGAGNSVTFTFKTTDKTFNQYSQPFSRVLNLTARNNTATGSVADFSIRLLISRESASALVAPLPSTVTSYASLSGGTINIPANSPTGASVSFSVSSDGATLTVTVTAIDSAARQIAATLH